MVSNRNIRVYKEYYDSLNEEDKEEMEPMMEEEKMDDDMAA